MDELTEHLLELFESLALGRMELLAALAWPLLVFWIVWMLRHQLRYLIANIREVEGPSGLRILLGEASAAARALAEATEPTSEQTSEQTGGAAERVGTDQTSHTELPSTGETQAASRDRREPAPGNEQQPARGTVQYRYNIQLGDAKLPSWLKNASQAWKKQNARSHEDQEALGRGWAKELLAPLEVQLRVAAGSIRSRGPEPRRGIEGEEIDLARLLGEDEGVSEEEHLFDSLKVLQANRIVSPSFVASFLSLHEVASQQVAWPRADEYLEFQSAVSDLSEVLERSKRRGEE